MLGVAFEVDPADVAERPEPGELPELTAVRLAREKALAVARRRTGAWVLAADTLVVLDGEGLGKPVDASDARRQLRRLSGREHRVVTAVALARGDRVDERCDVTRVWFRELADAVIDAYVATGEPLDKAGSYGLQGYGAALVQRVDGDPFGVIGLPLRLVVDLLEAAGMPYRFTR